MSKTIFFLFVLLALTLGLSSAYAEHIPPRFIQASCTIIPVEPFYDCGQPLLLIWFDTVEYPPTYNYTNNSWEFEVLEEDERPLLGYAYYNLVTETTKQAGLARGMDIIVLGNSTDKSWYPEDNPWDSILYHEIKHILCECNFHWETDKKRDDGTFEFFSAEITLSSKT